MRIASSSLQLAASHVEREITVRSASAEVRVGRPAAPARPAAAAAATGGGLAAGSPGDAMTLDEIELLILLRFFRLAPPGRTAAEAVRQAFAGQRDLQAGLARLAEAQAAPAAQGWSVRLDAVETTTQVEATTFQAAGQVATEDGRVLDVAIARTLQREATERREVHVRAGDAARSVDPLVLDLDGGPARFEGTSAFDLDGDGAAEQVATLAPGAAYLALDRDGNGQVDSGRELFGPATGSGFGELRALDVDGNGWVDEGDPAFDQLALWSPAEGGLRSLRAAGVGALYTGAVATPFQVNGADGAAQARVAETGVFLREDGSAAALEHVDLVV